MKIKIFIGSLLKKKKKLYYSYKILFFIQTHKIYFFGIFTLIDKIPVYAESGGV